MTRSPLQFLSAAALVLGLSIALAAQAPAPPDSGSSGPAPRRHDGKPDLTGVWRAPYVPDMTRNGSNQRGYAEAPFSPSDTPQARQALYATGNRAELPFTEWGLKEWVSYDPANDDATGNCFPYGLTRMMNSPYPIQIMQDEQHIAFLFELDMLHHIVPFSDRLPKHAADNPTWYGYSLARWDGDTLIVESQGFNGYTRLDTIGHPHSDQLRVIQTFRRLDADRLAHTITIDDPKTYTRPWSNERIWTRMNEPLFEYSCEENNKSLWEGRIKRWTPPWARQQQ
jgi:hypothetical protein